MLREEAEAEGRDWEPDWDSSGDELSQSPARPARALEEAPDPEDIEARPFGAAAAASSGHSPTASVRAWTEGGRAYVEC